MHCPPCVPVNVALMHTNLRGLVGLAAVPCAILLGGCPEASGTRTCAAFGHPAAAAWGQAPTGAALRFGSPAGPSSYTVTDVRVDPERSVSVPGSSDDEVTCTMRRQQRLVLDGGSAAFVMTFEQIEPRRGTPIAEQTLSLKVRPDTSADALAPLVEYSFRIDQPAAATNAASSGGSTRRYDAQRSIGSVNYQDVLEEALVDPAKVYASGRTPAALAWVRVVVARDAGLVQFERLDGSVHTRSP